MLTIKPRTCAPTGLHIDRINQALSDTLSANNYVATEILETARYAVTSEGHRWRPILFLKIYEELSSQAAVNSVLPIACAIEYLHTASLILDDLPAMDDARTRRGKKPCHQVFGPASAVLASIWLCDLAQSLVHDYQCRTCTTDLESLVRVTKAEMITGQYIDIQGRDLTREEIIETCRLKSGALYAFSASAPAHILGLSDIASRLDEAGSYLGVAYQVCDDIRDTICGRNELELGTSNNKQCTLPSKYGISEALKVRDLYKHKTIYALRTVQMASREVSDLVETICS